MSGCDADIAQSWDSRRMQPFHAALQVPPSFKLLPPPADESRAVYVHSNQSGPLRRRVCLWWLIGSSSAPVSAFIDSVLQTSNWVPESHTGFWDHLERALWALLPADKPGVSGVAILEELRPFPWTNSCCQWKFDVCFPFFPIKPSNRKTQRHPSVHLFDCLNISLEHLQEAVTMSTKSTCENLICRDESERCPVRGGVVVSCVVLD